MGKNNPVAKQIKIKKNTIYFDDICIKFKIMEKKATLFYRYIQASCGRVETYVGMINTVFTILVTLE